MESERDSLVKFKRCGVAVESDISPKKVKLLHNDDADREETNFYKLFKDILNTFIHRDDIPKDEINKAIFDIKKSFVNVIVDGGRFDDLDLNQTAILCGYLYRYAPHGAGLVRNRTLEALKNCDILKCKFRENELNVVSLGGGPGNDMIGFCSALWKVSWHGRLNLTVIDSVQRWSSCLNLAQFFIREGNYGDVSQLFRNCDVSMSFVRMKVPERSSSTYIQSVSKADIIILPKLISIMSSTDKDELCVSLFDNMKPGALLLFIDSPFYPDDWRNFDILYKSECADYKKTTITERFGHNDEFKSVAQIAVLRKILQNSVD